MDGADEACRYAVAERHSLAMKPLSLRILDADAGRLPSGRIGSGRTVPATFGQVGVTVRLIEPAHSC